jgi:hypothetical protein
MTEQTIALHKALIRAAKGMLKAWESWLEAESKPTTN